MSLSSLYCTNKFKQQFDINKLKDNIKDKLGMEVNDIAQEMTYILYKLLNNNPNYYYSKDILNEIYYNLESLYNATPNVVWFDETMFEFFMMGYEAYINISETISDLHDFNINSSIKTRLYRLPVYTSLIESVLGSFLKIIAIMIGNCIGKDYTTQNTIKKLKNVLEANGFTLVTNQLNENIRNSINHGTVSTINNSVIEELKFYYTENHISKSVSYKIYEFDSMLDNLYDASSAVLLAIALFLNNHYSVIVNIPNRKDLLFKYLSLRYSLPGIKCTRINDIDDNKQINIEYYVDNTDRGYLGQISVMTVCMIYNEFSNYNNYLVGFSNERMCPGFIRFTNTDVRDMFNGTRTYDAVMSEVIKRSEFFIMNKSDEDIDLNEYKYFVFPNVIKENYLINQIADASIEDRKRLKANLFIGNTTDKTDILHIIESAIQDLIQIKNPPNPKLKIKHGNMQADSIYINVYREDMRANKEIYSSNTNFVCFVDYNLSGETSLKDGGLPSAI